jgi:hypothetical protein
MIILVLYLTELFWSSKHQVSREIVYEIIENIKPENHHLLKQDLESRTGLNIERIQIGNVDFLRDTAQITIYFLDAPKTN